MFINNQRLASYIADLGFTESIISQVAIESLDAWLIGRVIQLINCCRIISNQRNKYKDRLVVHDVNLALDVLSWNTAYQSIYHKLDETTVSNEEFNLNDILKESIKIPPIPLLTVNWLAINGQYCANKNIKNKPVNAIVPNCLIKSINEFICEINKDYKDANVINKNTTKTLLSEHNNINKTATNINDFLSNSDAINYIIELPNQFSSIISEQEKLYLSKILACILENIELERQTDDDTKLHKTLNKLAISRISHSLRYGPVPLTLIPLLFASICNSFAQIIVNGPINSCEVLLSLLISLSQNDRVGIHPYVYQITQCILLIILTPYIGTNEKQDIHKLISLKIIAAESLAQLLDYFHNYNLFETIISIYSNMLNSESQPITTVIGIVFSCKVLGMNCIKKVVLPICEKVLKSLSTMQHNEDELKQMDNESYNYLIELLMQTLTEIIDICNVNLNI